MVNPNALAYIREQLAKYDGNDRMKSLFIYGTYTDRVRHTCECCGTDLVIIEHAGPGHDFINTHKRWVEIAKDDGPTLMDLVFRDHDPARCEHLRKWSRP